MMENGVDGVAGWWSDALKESAAEESARPVSVDATFTKEKIAQWRTERRPLPKSRGQARKDVGRALHEFESSLCGICGTNIDIGLAFPHPGSLQLDHVYPQAGFGGDSWDNIQLAHAHCNVLKSSYIDGYPRQEQAAESLNTAVVHWNDLSKLEADLREVGERWMEMSSRQSALVAELEQLSESDPQREVRRKAELYPLYVEREAIHKTMVLYLNRLYSHQRRSKLPPSAGDQSHAPD